MKTKQNQPTFTLLIQNGIKTPPITGTNVPLVTASRWILLPTHLVKWDITGSRETNDPQLFTPEGGEAAAPKKEEEENLFATSGRGIQIIKAITQYVSYETNSGLNETKFVFNRRSAES